jgi:hypothetical protein
MLSSICTNRYDANYLKKHHDFFWVDRMWCGIDMYPILRCFVIPEGLSCRVLLVGVVSKLVSWLMV